jgi:hypothetical protein
LFFRGKRAGDQAPVLTTSASLAAIGFQRTVAMSDTNFPDYADIRRMAAATKLPVEALLALSDDRDPFYMRPGRLAAAHWFADVWRVLNPANGVHLRRLHYRYVSLPAGQRPPKLDGSVYQNTEKDWHDLTVAATDARALGLVDASMFIDARAGDPLFIADDNGQDESVSVTVYGTEPDGPPIESAFAFDYEPTEYEFPDLPSVYVGEPRLAEPYAIEIWAEKSTMNDILLPLAQRMNVSLIPGVGDLSYTHCALQIARVLSHRKRARILYVSDFDPSGARMPIGAARKIEYLIRRDQHDVDVRLDPVVLTADQVRRFALPRIPIKDSDKGKRRFEAQHGEGATELDALEALHPGELARIVGAAVDLYREPTREAKRENRAIAAQARADLDEVREEVLEEFAEEIADLRHHFGAMQARIESRQAALASIAEDARARREEHVEAINAEAEAFHERAEELWSRIGEALEERVPDVGEIEWASPAEPDEIDDPLFDSARGYLEQIDRYKAHQGEPTPGRGNGNGGAP